MSSFPSLPLFTDAFIADTGHLSATQTGAYLMLLMVAWRSPDCRLPDDDAKLARWARVDARTWPRLKPAVMEFWTLEDGFWSQKRLSKERYNVRNRADIARLNGSAGGRPKSLKSNDPRNPAGSLRVTQEKASISISNNNPYIPVETGTKTSGTDEAFLAFKEAYPKRDGAQDWTKAKDRFRRHVTKGIQADDLVAAARAYRAEVERKGNLGTSYVKQAATFLSTVWQDYLTAPQPTAQAVGLPAGWPSYFPAPDVVRTAWASRLWADAWGPRPGEPGCLVSPSVLNQPANAGGAQ